ncbi:metal-sensitive transcriptional regulator, partial [Candidatus Roizmanbacteria bacterium]|nr:metal-sensitive transcriptional regulator [Candidatus Roizmanbacteria bacterium]
MDTQKRINRLIGQLKGIQRMVDTQRDCTEVLQQISAVKKAIDGLSKMILVSDICQYVPQKDSKKVEQIVERA